MWEVVSGSFVNFKLCTFDPEGQSISILRRGSCIHQIPETEEEEKNGESRAEFGGCQRFRCQCDPSDPVLATVEDEQASLLFLSGRCTRVSADHSRSRSHLRLVLLAAVSHPAGSHGATERGPGPGDGRPGPSLPFTPRWPVAKFLMSWGRP